MLVEEIPEGYAVPLSVIVRSGKIQDQDVLVLDMAVVAVEDNTASDPMRAVLVLTPEDAATLAANILAEAGEENK